MWKGVKGIFKLLKPKHPISSLRLDSEDEVLNEWSSEDMGGGDAESAGDDTF